MAKPKKPRVPTTRSALCRVPRCVQAWEAEDGDLALVYNVADTLTGETFTRATSATYFDVNGVLQTATSGTKRDGHFITGVQSLLMEGARTNVVLWNRDLTNAAWVATTMTALKDQTGIDGVATSASSLLATGANSTLLQSITLGSSARFQTAYIKRLVGTGNVDMTMDNGATWTTVTTTAAWTQLSIPTQTLANPIVGFRLVTSGDKIAVDYVQNENGAFASSVIATTTVAVARNADVYSIPFAAVPEAISIYVKMVELGTIQIVNGRVVEISSSSSVSPRMICAANVRYQAQHNNSTTVTSLVGTPAAVTGDVVEVVFRLFPDGSVDVQESINGGVTIVSTQTAALALAAAWSGSFLWVNTSGAGTGNGFAAFQALRILTGVRSINEMRTA